MHNNTLGEKSNRLSILLNRYFSALLLSALISSEGIFVFLILVVFRSRIRNAIVRRWFSDVTLVPQKWKTEIDTDSEVDSNFEFVDGTVKTADNDEKRVVDNGSVSIIVSENT